MKTQEIITKIQTLNKKNEQTDGYSLGDVLLLEKYEKELLYHGFTNDQLIELSPSYYKINDEELRNENITDDSKSNNIYENMSDEEWNEVIEFGINCMKLFEP